MNNYEKMYVSKNSAKAFFTLKTVIKHPNKKYSKEEVRG